MDDIILSTQNGEPVASSRDVAKRFGKEHKHVLAAIRQLLVAEIRLLNSSTRPSSSIAARNSRNT